MKKIEAIVKPFRVDAVKEALIALGVAGMTTMEVKGFGRQKGHAEIYRGSEYTIEFVPKTLFIVVIRDDQLEAAMEAIVSAAQTESIGDGRLFVSAVDEVIRIRTEDKGDAAI